MSGEVVQIAADRPPERKDNPSQIDYWAGQCSSFPCAGSGLCLKCLGRRDRSGLDAPTQCRCGCCGLALPPLSWGLEELTHRKSALRLPGFISPQKNFTKTRKKTSAQLSYSGISKALTVRFQTHACGCREVWHQCIHQPELLSRLSWHAVFPCWRWCVSFMGTNRWFAELVLLPFLSRSIHHYLPCGSDRG